MKTAMQEFIEKLEFIKLNKTKNLHDVMFFDGVLAIIDAEKYLEKEKEHLMMAFNDGKTNAVLKKRTSEEYYDQLYNQ
jgi:hypothetical protein